MVPLAIRFNKWERFKDTPQGGILSTAEDMSKYMIMQLQKGTFKDKEIISKKGIDMMHLSSF